MINFLFIFLALVNEFKVAHLINQDQTFWQNTLSEEIEQAERIKWNTKKAKNIILFIGDGMGMDTLTAARIFNKGEDGYQAFEKFPHVGLIKTYNADKLIPESASTATAIYSGVKTNALVAGLTPNVKLNDCKNASNSTNHLKTILNWAQEAHKSTGFITTATITHATPMALYAKIPHRDWECDSAIPKECRPYVKDIARQLIENSPGRHLNVIMGGGLQALQAVKQFSKDTCNRTDGTDLVKTWIEYKKLQKIKGAVALTMSDLMRISPENTDSLLGVFANGYLPYADERISQKLDTPSLANMTTVALKMLKKNKNGFFLMIESGKIDLAHHKNLAHRALNETVALNDAIEVALDLMKNELEETLIIVTADHAQALKFSGELSRGKNIFGVSDELPTNENVPYTPLQYFSGESYPFIVNATGKPSRKNPVLDDLNSYKYQHQAFINTEISYHSGADVVVYAKGPKAYLFHSLHEQPYIAHVMAYAAQIGPYANNNKSGTNANFPFSNSTLTITFMTIIFIIFWY